MTTSSAEAISPASEPPSAGGSLTPARVVILVVAVLAVMASVFFLPRQLGYQPMGLILDLPESLPPWQGRVVEVTEKEHEVLGFDTDFARRIYSSGNADSILASIVLAGQDMMTGIHRPERCLLAQGWQPGESARRTIDIPGFGKLNATRLRNSRRVRDGDKVMVAENVCYYWFVGFTDMAATHEQRVSIDFRDRILKGYNQRWAMVMISSDIMSGRLRNGRNAEETAQLLEFFIKNLAPKILSETVRPH